MFLKVQLECYRINAFRSSNPAAPQKKWKKKVTEKNILCVHLLQTSFGSNKDK